MKNLSVILLTIVCLLFAAMADAAPRKRTRNANRIGPYVVGFVEQSTYPNDQSLYENDLVDTLEDRPEPTQTITSSSDDSDLGYQAVFGYRFTRWFAAELGLAQFGSVTSNARADLDFGEGFVPVNLQYEFSTGGPVFSAVGILPVNDKFEAFVRLGYMFSSSEREFSASVDGQSDGAIGPKGESQDMVLGLGAQYHFNQMYSLRVEYQQVDEVGDPDRTGVEDIRAFGLGLLVRF